MTDRFNVLNESVGLLPKRLIFSENYFDLIEKKQTNIYIYFSIVMLWGQTRLVDNGVREKSTI